MYGELLRGESLLLYEHYIRHLIARDFLSRDDTVKTKKKTKETKNNKKPNTLSSLIVFFLFQISKTHRGYLRSFPIQSETAENGIEGATEATRAKNQRRIALYGLHAPVREEQSRRN
jgi:hypothetical protein